MELHNFSYSLMILFFILFSYEVWNIFLYLKRYFLLEKKDFDAVSGEVKKVLLIEKVYDSYCYVEYEYSVGAKKYTSSRVEIVTDLSPFPWMKGLTSISSEAIKNIQDKLARGDKYIEVFILTGTPTFSIVSKSTAPYYLVNLIAMSFFCVTGIFLIYVFECFWSSTISFWLM